MDRLKTLLTVHKKTVFLIGILILLGVLGWWGFQKFISKDSGPAEEIDLAFDPEGPYAQLIPRRDGNALILNLKRTSAYDEINYELSYTSLPDTTTVSGKKITDEEGSTEGSIDRGVAGTIDTKDKKGEYEQEILFGSCSKNVCKYDQGVENGTLSLKIKKKNKSYKMITQWHLQKVDVVLGSLNSLDGHFSYKIADERQDLTIVGFSIINDLTGVPKLPSGKEVLGKVYSLNVPLAKSIPTGQMSVELSENPSSDAKVYRYDGSSNKWEELQTNIEDSKLSSTANGAGIFAVLTNKK